MNQIDELPLSELERSLPGRLRASAEALSPEPEALTAVRARAAVRRRRSRTTVLVGSAAAVAIIAVGVGLVSGDDPTTGVAAGPANGTDPTTTVAPVPVAEADATLIIYRYPNATPEIIAEDPKMGGEWATLITSDRRYHANGPLAELGANSPWEPSGVTRALDSLDSLSEQDPALVITTLLAGEFPGSPVPTVAPDQSDEMKASALLMGLLMSGEADASQALELRRLLESLPGTSVEESGGTVRINEDYSDTWVEYDPTTGHPVRNGWRSAPESTVEYVSVTRVRAADLLVPGRGTPPMQSTTTTSLDESLEPATTTSMAAITGEGRG